MTLREMLILIACVAGILGIAFGVFVCVMCSKYQNRRLLKRWMRAALNGKPQHTEGRPDVR